jgi:Co/Zn/Cd efflux system component
VLLVFLLFLFCCREKRVMGRFTGKKCRLVSMFWLTLFFFLVEIVVGYVTNSMALVADSFHMLSDVAALVVAFLSVKVSGMVWCNCVHAIYFAIICVYAHIPVCSCLGACVCTQFCHCRCLQRNGQKIRLVGLGLRSWERW